MTAGGRSHTVTDTQIASPMPGDIHSMKHWKLSKMPNPERSAVIFQAKPCARTGRKKTAESNQHEMRRAFSMLATIPCRGLSLSTDKLRHSYRAVRLAAWV